MTPAAQALLADLNTALTDATDPWRRKVLREITDLFLVGAEQYSDNEVAVFDDVMCLLIQTKDGDSAMLAELSNALAPIDNAPLKVIGNLLRHADIAVHGPILEQAKALPEKILLEIAGNQRAPALNKIAGRPLSQAVTDVLLKRADKKLQRKLVDNPRAGISDAGFARIISNLKGDKEFAAAIARRRDLPAELKPFLESIIKR